MKIGRDKNPLYVYIYIERDRVKDKDVYAIYYKVQRSWCCSLT